MDVGTAAVFVVLGGCVVFGMRNGWKRVQVGDTGRCAKCGSKLNKRPGSIASFPTCPMCGYVQSFAGK